MFLSRFVTEEDFPKLLRYLVQIGLKQLHKTTSIFVIGGGDSAGKTTIIRIIKKIVGCVHSVPYIDFFKKDLATNHLWYFNDNYVLSDDVPIDQIPKIHKWLNGEIIHRRMYHDKETISNPGTLIINVNINDKDYKFNTKPLNKNLVYIYCPYKFHYIDDYDYYINKTAEDIKLISQELKLYYDWLKFNYVINHCLIKDISTHFGSMIIKQWINLIPLNCIKELFDYC